MSSEAKEIVEHLLSLEKGDVVPNSHLEWLEQQVMHILNEKLELNRIRSNQVDSKNMASASKTFSTLR